MKKILILASTLLAISLLICSCGGKDESETKETTAKTETPAAKDPTIPSKGLEFVSNGDGTCYVKSTYTFTDTDVVIPAKSPAGDTVTSIGDYAFTGCESLTSIEIPSSVTSIGVHAFANCESLTSIEIPSSVTSIGNSAFSWDSSLTSIEIPSSVTSIGVYAFSHCTSLTRVTFANPNGWWRTRSFTATSGDSISSSDLSNASTAAEYLTSTYYDYDWRCN